MNQSALPKSLLPQAARRGLLALALLGGAALAVGLLRQPRGFWPSFLLAFYLFTGLALSGAVVLGITQAIGARWNTIIRRVPEAMASPLIYSLAGALLLWWGIPKLYSWADPEFVKHHPILNYKASWLSPSFFGLRGLIYVATWVILSRLMLRRSRLQDQDGRLRPGAKQGILFLFFFGYTFCLAAFDWIMSLEPTWYSTIFGLYCFAGVVQSGLAAQALLLLLADRVGSFQGRLRPEHRLDLGRLLFAFSCFWAYMWFSQYMLTWFADLPEENQYYLLRGGPWALLMGAVVAGRFALPFVALASQKAKGSPRVLGAVSAAVLVFHLLDVYLMIMPSSSASLLPGAYSLLLPLGAAAAFLLLFARAFESRPAVPLHDAGLEFSSHYRG